LANISNFWPYLVMSGQLPCETPVNSDLGTPGRGAHQCGRPPPTCHKPRFPFSYSLTTGHSIEAHESSSTPFTLQRKKMGNILRNGKLQRRFFKMKHADPNSITLRIFKEKCIYLEKHTIENEPINKMLAFLWLKIK